MTPSVDIYKYKYKIQIQNHLQSDDKTLHLEYLHADPGKTSLFLVKDKNEVLGLRLSHSVSATVSNGE